MTHHLKSYGSLTNILTLNFFLITVVPVFIIGGFVLSILGRNLTYDIVEKNSLLVETLGREVETSLEKSEASLRQLAYLIDQGKVTETGSMNSHLDSIIKHHGELEMVRLLDASGVVQHIAPFNKNYIGINMSYQPFIHATMTSFKSQWSSTFKSSQTRFPTIALCIPLKSGMLVGYLSLNSLKSIVDKIKIGALGYAFIVDSEGNFIAHPNQSYVAEQINLKNISANPSQMVAGNQKKTVWLQGREVFSNTTKVAGVNWQITIIQPVDEAFISYNKIKNTILVAIFLMLGLVMVLVLVIPKKILQPLFQLTEQSKRVAAGDVMSFSYQRSYSEVNDLADNFDIMIKAVHNREDQLRRSKEKAQKYLDIANVILLVLNRDKKVTLINKKGCEVLGYSEEEIIGYDWFDKFLPKRHRQPISTFVDQLLLGQIDGAQVKENSILRKDGQERILLWHNTVIKDELGCITGTLSSGEDITERKIAERALQESEERYKLATKASDNGIWDWWVYSGEIYFSDQWKAQLGYSPGELENTLKSWENLLHPECKGRVMKRVQAFVKEPYGDFVEEYRMRHKDSSYRWISNRASVVLKAGKVERMFGSHTDITARKESEKARKELEKQVAYSQKLDSLGVMASGVAHNFNNNLAIILGNNELLELELSSNHFALSCLQDSTAAIERSKDLVNQILTFSKRGSIESPPNFIVPVFNETITLLKSSLPGAVHIAVQIDEQVEDKIVFINPSQLQEIVINLANNAVYAMKEQGQLVVSIGLRRLSQQDIPIENKHLGPGEFVELMVADNGPGISQQDIDKIFDPFFTTKPSHEGTGMGLSMVQGIVSHSQGFIVVESAPPKGTTFSVYFKTTTAQPATPKKVLQGSAQGRQESILFVDDEVALAKLGSRLLERNGYKVTSLTNPEQALEMIKLEPRRFQLVISDQLMPQMTGAQLLAAIFKIAPQLKAIIYSGNIDKVDKDIVDKIGSEFVLKKPLNHEHLLQKIRVLLERS